MVCCQKVGLNAYLHDMGNDGSINSKIARSLKGPELYVFAVQKDQIEDASHKDP